MSKISQKIIDGIKNFQSTGGKSNVEVKDVLSAQDCTIAKVVRHGFPHEPKCMAYDPVQKLLAVGCENGSIRIFGRPGVDCHLKHESSADVFQLQFLVNEGALLAACRDDYVHLWNFRQKRPEIVHSLQFQKEQITCIHIPFQSQWFYVGTEKGNVHVVNIADFKLSGYVINWNKAIDLSQRNHPGSVRHLSDCPTDEAANWFRTGDGRFMGLETESGRSKVPMRPELLHGVYFALYNGAEVSALRALDDIHQRASFELYPDVLLTTNAVIDGVTADPALLAVEDGPFTIRASSGSRFSFSEALSPSTDQKLSVRARALVTNASLKVKRLPEDIPVKSPVEDASSGGKKKPLATIVEVATTKLKKQSSATHDATPDSSPLLSIDHSPQMKASKSEISIEKFLHNKQVSIAENETLSPVKQLP